ncbi:ADP-ribosylation factor-like protein 3 [Scaptodrosophila lebanonensis]|uniref:ADP-ribosylation factor-like protein 6 n=1 Tax=Drosophila lebanonensis TaxID=7225 RepID=A0A6J2SZX8_DROLE|nr:ADP-ribosylation factor-like protein 3 [Scaptodrosophila lebanonensis]
MCLCYVFKSLGYLARTLLSRSAKELRLLVLGLDNAGKTTLVARLGPKAEGVRIRSVVGGSSKEIVINRKKLRFLDLSGQWGRRQIWRNYYGSANALIYVIDSTDAQRLGEARSELFDILLDKRLENTPLLIMSNKQDQVGAMPTSDVTNSLGLTRFERRNWLIQDCSALTGNGVEQAMDWIYRTIKVEREPTSVESKRIWRVSKKRRKFKYWEDSNPF